ncbi:DUF397 domain-containing protein [Streptomyces rimosus]|uniref:DUF397 domain-containing protein n=1 Tax=Streptomyces rimosus TaxID=1927 RepID=UPI00099739FA|nr:DUF397 domain-containing protein [Streptomyces rimosus]
MPRLTWQTPHPGGPILYREGDHPATVGRATAPSWAAFLRAVKSNGCALKRD